MEIMLTVSSPPHIYGTDTISRRMRDVLIALLPACLLAIHYYGEKAFVTIAAAIASAVFAEHLYRKVMGKTSTINDLSAAITGLLLAFNLPPDVPVWIPVIGSVFAIVIVKQLFGGLGSNFVNPALASRAFLLGSFPVQLTNWTLPADAVSGATYLAHIKINPGFLPQLSDYSALLLGKIGGCIGETSALALIAGGIYLIIKRVINWRIPFFYIASFSLCAFIFGRTGVFTGDVLFEALNGGLMLGAFFMATDYATSPISPKGKVIMGIGCGFLTVMIRFYGGYPEGVSYAILIMNLFVPLIDKFIRPRVYGRRINMPIIHKKEKEK
jgi:electron transport complex protein RnfD